MKALTHHDAVLLVDLSYALEVVEHAVEVVDVRYDLHEGPGHSRNVSL